ncbi:MAG: mechanosensitive ion channel family protein [Cytophagales bacterium]|nr:mechanosensitive ion channel family protein [Cytophagales bacterium]
MEEKEAFRAGNFVKDFGKVLNDYWERFLFLLPNLLFAALILVVTLFLAGKAKSLLRRRLSGKTHDKITAEYLSIISRWIVVVAGVLLACQALGLSGIAGGLLASAGVSAVVVGFAFKDIAQNFLAGLILAFNRPFNVDDTVKIDDTMGRVVALDLRTTHLRTFDSKDVYIPNGIILTTPVTNFTRNGLIRIDFTVGIDYSDDTEKAIALIEATVSGVEGVQRKNPPYATVDELATNTVNLKVFFFTETDDYKKGAVLLKGKVMQEVKKALLGNGFGLPANIVELKMYDGQQKLPVELTGQLSQNGKVRNP